MKITKSLSLLKKNCITLRVNNQLPVALCSRIMALSGNESEEYVKKLMYYTDQYMRVKGFYKKYPLIASQYNRDIEELFK